MTLLSTLQYEPKLRTKETSANDIIDLLSDIRNDIAILNPEFAETSLREILEIAESEENYKTNNPQGGVVEVNLSKARAIISSYRHDSEGGCKSCKSLGRETLDAQDATTGFYCMDSDPAFDAQEVRLGRNGCKYSGFSPKVREHYHTPCESWQPKQSPPIETLIYRHIQEVLMAN